MCGDPDGCEWANVSPGTGPPGQSRSKAVKWVCVCVYCTVGGTVPDASLLPDVSGLREELLATLEHALLGDRLAAEYLLCHLTSSV